LVARLLLSAARGRIVRKLAVLVPDRGGDLRLARALARAAAAQGLEADTVFYVAGRSERRSEAARLRARGFDAVALLGPGEESADWLPALRAGGGGGLLVLGTDEIDPLGFHEQARRADEGAIFVRGTYVPSDTSWTAATDAVAWIAGWVVGDAIAHGADSPGTLEKALRARVTESDAGSAWLNVPPEIARVEVLRVHGGRAEPLP
jgi:hypothetical protein